MWQYDPDNGLNVNIVVNIEREYRADRHSRKYKELFSL